MRAEKHKRVIYLACVTFEVVDGMIRATRGDIIGDAPPQGAVQTMIEHAVDSINPILYQGIENGIELPDIYMRVELDTESKAVIRWFWVHQDAR